MTKVTVVIRGLVDLVSDGSSQMEKAFLLMPNAEKPSAEWIPKSLRFKKRHRARLVVLKGVRHGGLPGAEAEPTGSGILDDGYLTGKEVVLEPELKTEQGESQELVVQRTTGDGPRGHGPDDSVDYVADIDELVENLKPELGCIKPGLTNQYGEIVTQRLTARVCLTSGTLTASDLWEKKMMFQMVPPPTPPGPAPLPEKYMARALCLSGWIDQDCLTVHLKSLANGTSCGQPWVVQADGGVIDLLIENSPEDHKYHDNHFLAHYWLRECLPPDARAFTPWSAAWAHGAGLDPQCSPGRNNG